MELQVSEVSIVVMPRAEYHCGNNTPDPLSHTFPGTGTPPEAVDGWA